MSHSVRLKTKLSRSSLNIANLDVDLDLVWILDLDPSLKMFRFQKCLQVSSVIVKTSLLVLSANIIKK